MWSNRSNTKTQPRRTKNSYGRFHYTICCICCCLFFSHSKLSFLISDRCVALHTHTHNTQILFMCTDWLTILIIIMCAFLNSDKYCCLILATNYPLHRWYSWIETRTATNIISRMLLSGYNDNNDEFYLIIWTRAIAQILIIVFEVVSSRKKKPKIETNILLSDLSCFLFFSALSWKTSF